MAVPKTLNGKGQRAGRGRIAPSCGSLSGPGALAHGILGTGDDASAHARATLGSRAIPSVDERVEDLALNRAKLA